LSLTPGLAYMFFTYTAHSLLAVYSRSTNRALQEARSILAHTRDGRCDDTGRGNLIILTIS